MEYWVLKRKRSVLFILTGGRRKPCLGRLRPLELHGANVFNTLKLQAFFLGTAPWPPTSYLLLGKALSLLNFRPRAKLPAFRLAIFVVNISRIQLLRSTACGVPAPAGRKVKRDYRV